jgi:hypothetical protein
MKTRPTHAMWTHAGAFRLAERIARRTGERQRVELVSPVGMFHHPWRVVPVEAPTDSYDPADYANGGTA